MVVQHHKLLYCSSLPWALIFLDAVFGLQHKGSVIITDHIILQPQYARRHVLCRRIHFLTASDECYYVLTVTHVYNMPAYNPGTSYTFLLIINLHTACQPIAKIQIAKMPLTGSTMQMCSYLTGSYSRLLNLIQSSQY